MEYQQANDLNVEELVLLVGSSINCTSPPLKWLHKIHASIIHLLLFFRI
ncbi:hypothetical protein RintRC_6112 [Richelia intracellularis]|nr:hypothetical protein RintRC_6112 [Richelia intracellularis]